MIRLVFCFADGLFSALRTACLCFVDGMFLLVESEIRAADNSPNHDLNPKANLNA